MTLESSYIFERETQTHSHEVQLRPLKKRALRVKIQDFGSEFVNIEFSRDDYENCDSGMTRSSESLGNFETVSGLSRSLDSDFWLLLVHKLM